MPLYGFSTKMDFGERVRYKPDNSVGIISAFNITLARDKPEHVSARVVLDDGSTVDCTEDDLEKLTN